MRKLAAIVLVSLLPWFGVPVVEAAGSVSRVPLLHGVATSQGDVTRVSHNGVEIETLTGKAAIAHLRASHASTTTLSSAEGELVLWSWDDGDPFTWEGTVFMAAYGDKYAEHLSDTQIDIGSVTACPVFACLDYHVPP